MNRRERVALPGALLLAICAVATGATLTTSGGASRQALATPAAPLPASFLPALARDIPGAATPEPRWPLTIAAVGDVMLARDIAASLRTSPEGPFAYAVGDLSTADLALANLESPIATGGAPVTKAYTFRAPPEAATTIAASGIDVVSFANNHAGDYGPDALAETLALLGAAGVRHAGAGLDATVAARPATVTVRGLDVAVLAFNDAGVEVGRSAWEAGPGSPGVAWWDDGRSSAAIRAAAADADLVIVALHFGFEYASEPSPRQREIAHAAIDAGATLVLGAHPHVLQEVETYGEGLIAYSLGNFVFDGFSGTANETAILRASIAENGAIEWSLIPYHVGPDGIPRPVP